MATIHKVSGSLGDTSTSGEWGKITGDINDQYDLLSLLNQEYEKNQELVELESQSRIYNDKKLGNMIDDESRIRESVDSDLDSKIAWKTIKEPFYDRETGEVINDSLRKHFNKYNPDVDLVIGTFPIDVPLHWYKRFDPETDNWVWDYNVTGKDSEGKEIVDYDYGQVLCVEYWKADKDDSISVNNFNELVKYCNRGKDIILENDIEIISILPIKHSLKINLNGYNLKGNIEFDPIVRISNGCTVEITGTGTVENINDSGKTFEIIKEYDQSKLVFSGGRYNFNPISIENCFLKDGYITTRDVDMYWVVKEA